MPEIFPLHARFRFRRMMARVLRGNLRMDLPGEPPKAEPAAPARGGTALASTTSEWGTFSLVGLFVILALYALHEIKPFLLPLVLAVLVSLVLHPVHQALRRIRVPRLLAAALTMAGLLGLLGFGAYQLAVPGARWLKSLDDKDLSAKLRETFRPMTRFGAGIREVADTVEQAAAIEPPPDETASATGDRLTPKGEEYEIPPTIAAVPEPAPPPKPVVVEIREDPLATAISEIQKFGLKTGTFLILVLFILAYGNRIAHRLGDGAGPILERMAADVSRYLFTITLINTCLGICIGLAMWALGMPNPALWGLLGTLLELHPLSRRAHRRAHRVPRRSRQLRGRRHRPGRPGDLHGAHRHRGQLSSLPSPSADASASIPWSSSSG